MSDTVSPMVLQRINLDIVPGKIPPIVYVSEYDTGREIVVYLFRDGYPYGKTAENANWSIKVEGSIGQYGFSEDASWADDGDEIVFHLTEAMTAIRGRVWTKIKITDSNGQRISTCGFWMDVDRAGVETETVIGAPGFEGQIQAAVDAWLESDDGIGDAVQTAVNDYADEHGLVLSNGFVTPEDYGARGDGTTDDTAAIQLAVDSGRNVMFGYGKTYRCGQINVTKNIEIDCRWSEFVCTAEKLFYCHGTVDSSVAGADYVAGENYALPNGDTYTGFAVLRSEDNIISERDYYYGGFVALFDDGVCNFRRPVSFSGVTVDKVTPITCVIRNIGVVTHPSNTFKNYTVYCLYGLNCVFDDFVVDGEKYSVVTLKRCFRCVTRNVNGFASYTGSYENYYPVGGNEISECLFENCSLTSDWWCCFDIGGEILAFDNVVDNCKFHMGNGGIAIGSHANNIGFEIRNSEFDNGNFWGNSKIKNCKVYANAPAKDAGYNTCMVNFRATNLGAEANKLTIDGLEFVVNENNAPGQRARFGISVACTGNRLQMHGTVGNITIKHIRVSDPTAIQFPSFHINSGSDNQSDLTFKGLIVLEDIVGEVWCPVSERTIFDSNCRMIIRDSFSRDNGGVRIGVAKTDVFPPDVSIEDCLVMGAYGVFQTLRMSNVYQNGYSIAQSDTITGESLIANDIGLIEADTIKRFTNAKIVNMRYNVGQTWAFVSKDSANGAYKVRYSVTSGIVKEEL